MNPLKTFGSLQSLEESPGFADAWGVCRGPLLSFLNERLISRAKSLHPGTPEIAMLIDELRGLGFTASLAPPPLARMPALNSMSDDQPKQ